MRIYLLCSLLVMSFAFSAAADDDALTKEVGSILEAVIKNNGLTTLETGKKSKPRGFLRIEYRVPDQIVRDGNLAEFVESFNATVSKYNLVGPRNQPLVFIVRYSRTIIEKEEMRKDETSLRRDANAFRFNNQYLE